MLCVGLLIMFCDPPRPIPPVDSYCQVYRRVIAAQGDGAEVGKLKRKQRDAISHNDVYYRCRCEGWANPICEKMRAK